jgi:hypothetical protein
MYVVYIFFFLIGENLLRHSLAQEEQEKQEGTTIQS